MEMTSAIVTFLRFKDDLSGEVIYENIRAGTVKSSYAGLRFPAGDIPAPARRLFVLNRVRLIHDIEAVDVPVVGATLPSGEKLDLSLSSLRAVSKMHILYLRNMGVVASMSVAIIVDEVLWGLFVFHCYTEPVSPTMEQRIMIETATSVSSVRIGSFMHAARMERTLKLMAVLSAVAESTSLFAYLEVHSASLLYIIGADTIVVCEGTAIAANYGDPAMMPTAWGLRELNRRCGLETVILLSSFKAGLRGNGCGVAFLRMPHVQVAFVRSCNTADVTWGGCPDEAKAPLPNGMLEPRASFAAYMEQGRTEARPWSAEDKDIVTAVFDSFRELLRQQTLRSFELRLERSNADASEAYKAAQGNYEYFAQMSHELRTPFHGIMGSLQLLQDASGKLSAEDQDDIVAGALDCGEGLLKTLDNILAVSKNKYRVELAAEPLCWPALLYDVRSVCTPYATQKGVTLKMGIATSWPDSADGRVVGDSTVIVQTVQNLVNNALKFTAAGGDVVVSSQQVASYQAAYAIWTACAASFEHSYWSQPEGKLPVQPSSWTEAQVRSATWFLVQVEDTGIGIESREDLIDIFKPYYQLSSGVSKAHQGTGLGLHISLSHARKCGGALGVASTMEKGTLFLFALPLQLARPGPSTPAASAPASPSGASLISAKPREPSFFGGVGNKPQQVVERPRVLLVDDSTLNLRLCQHKLALVLGQGAEFLVARDGSEAVTAYAQSAVADERPVNAILMDYHMPNMNGQEAIVRIRALEKEYALPAVPIAAYTAGKWIQLRHVVLSA
ncbi:hypothetical protein JKP88DRAFT_277482 [Tribonema minus]|uniref:histidine kinase n=1 Tax=Tribonema minus TaxID=303371 RepID=A0A835YY76_9STRA|nr:hypothetical protein JKP88DRAFT_277482 [Tribonema minus]